MPIGGSAYYDNFKKNRGAKAEPAKVTAPIPPQPPVKEKALAKSSVSSDWGGRPAKKMRPAHGSGSAVYGDPSALDPVVEQILDLAQRVHAVAGQAEAAVLRAEAAVMKAEIAVGKAEAAGSRADAAFSKCDVAVSRADSAAFKSEASAKRAELSASKAGLAAGKSELAAVGRDVNSIVSEASGITTAGSEASEDAPAFAGEEDNRTKELNGPISQIAVMSMKLRSSMRQIEEEHEQTLERGGFLKAGSPLNITLGREDLASGLVSLDSDTALPRVAPFIMDDAGRDTASTEPANKDAADTEGRAKSTRSGAV